MYPPFQVEQDYRLLRTCCRYGTLHLAGRFRVRFLISWRHHLYRCHNAGNNICRHMYQGITCPHAGDPLPCMPLGHTLASCYCSLRLGAAGSCVRRCTGPPACALRAARDRNHTVPPLAMPPYLAGTGRVCFAREHMGWAALFILHLPLSTLNVRTYRTSVGAGSEFCFLHPPATAAASSPHFCVLRAAPVLDTAVSYSRLAVYRLIDPSRTAPALCGCGEPCAALCNNPFGVKHSRCACGARA